jgi:arylsulfatase A-like enzyme
MANLLIIMADDMRFDELDYMPNTRRLLRGRGTNFTGCRIDVPLCSPARTGLLTGKYAMRTVPTKGHEVTTQGHLPDTAERDGNVFKRLDVAGFRCGGLGKMLSAAWGATAKPGFTSAEGGTWRAITGDGGSGYGIYEPNLYSITTETGATVTPGMYQDHYLTREAISFMEGTEPWCLWYCPTSNHWPWDEPAPNHTTEYALTNFPLTLEADVSDKPTWVQAQVTPTASELAEMQNDQRSRLRELLALDDTVGALVNFVDSTGRADDTTIIFTSDNGLMLGEHRVMGDAVGGRAIKKNLMYEPSMHVPLVVRGPAFPRQTIDLPTNHQDITATLLALGGATATLGDQVGINLASIAADPTNNTYRSRKLLHFRDTAGDGDGWPTSHGITTYLDVLTPFTAVKPRKLVRHVDTSGVTLASPDGFEMYDLDVDPDELVNVAYVPARLAERNALESALNTLRA